MIPPRDRPLALAAIGGFAGVIALASIISAANADSYRPDPRQEATRQRQAIADSASSTFEALLLAQRADSLARLLASRTWQAESLLVLVDSTIPAWRRDGDRRLLERSWASLPPHRGTVRVAVALVNDRPWPSSRTRRWLGERAAGFALPGSLDAQTCLVVLQRGGASFNSHARKALDSALAGRAPSKYTLIIGPPRETTLGACGFYAAYGRPGSGMLAWLDHTTWRAAGYATFARSDAERAPWIARWVDAPGVEGLLEALLLDEGSVHLSAQGCANGARGACWAFVNDSANGAAGNSTLGVVVPDQRFRRVGRGAVEAADPRPRLLDDLRHAIGEERFAQLWRDARPLPEAFAAITGQSLDGWLSAWARSSVQGDEATAGPAMQWRQVTTAAVPGALFLLMGLAIAGRRRMRPPRA